jgi:hypothetical protein
MIALVIGVTLLSACATGGFESPPVTVCPPVAEYDRAFLGQAAEELRMPPTGSAIEQMLGDYSVMRAQAWACR